MNPLPYMPLYWNDLLSDNKVRVQSNEEFGAYMRLLGAAWHEDVPGTLPADDDVLARLAGVESSLWRKLSRRILPCFTLNEQAARYEQKRMMEEHDKCVQQAEMKQSRAALGAEKRWEGHVKKPPSNAKAMLKHGSSNANQNQSQKDPLPRARAGPETPTLTEVKAFAANTGASAQAAETWWHDMEAVLWIDGRGRQIERWQPALTAFALRWAGNENEKKIRSEQRSNGNGHHAPEAPKPIRKMSDMIAAEAEKHRP